MMMMMTMMMTMMMMMMMMMMMNYVPIQAGAHSQKSWTKGDKVFHVILALWVC